MKIMELTKEWAHSMVPERPYDSHKGSCGRVLIVGGEMPGAGILAASSALRTGAGLVKLSCIKWGFQPAIAYMPEIMVTDFDSIDNLEYFDAVAVGPGAGKTLRTADLLRYIIENFSGNIVIDADGLGVLAEDETLKKAVRSEGHRIVLTPHPGEAARLLGTARISTEKRQQAAKTLAAEYNCTAVLKGPATLIATPDSGTTQEKAAGSQEQLLYRNTTGNPGMATAGSGDVLTGTVTAFLGMGVPVFQAGALGAYIHGLAGDMAAKKKGFFGMTAGDISENLPYAVAATSEYK